MKELDIFVICMVSCVFGFLGTVIKGARIKNNFDTYNSAVLTGTQYYISHTKEIP